MLCLCWSLTFQLDRKWIFNFEVSCFLQVAQFAVYQMLVSTIFPVFFSFYLGAWCDLFGRKLLFKIYLSARCMDQIIVILCAYFVNSPKEYLLLAKIPSSLAGTQKYLSKCLVKQIESFFRNRNEFCDLEERTLLLFSETDCLESWIFK